MSLQIKGSKIMKEVQACREIQKGEEIVGSYHLEKVFLTKTERKKELEKGWGFVCTCKLCVMSGKELETNDFIRKKLQGFDEDLKRSYNQGHDDAEMFKVAKEKVKLMMLIKEEVVLHLPEALYQCWNNLVALERYEESEQYMLEIYGLCCELGGFFMEDYNTMFDVE